MSPVPPSQSMQSKLADVASHAATALVSRSEFRDYVDSLDLKRRYPGIVAVHYAQRITAGQNCGSALEPRSMKRPSRRRMESSMMRFTTKPLLRTATEASRD